MKRLAATFTAAAIAASPALGAGWTIIDLGQTPDRPACMAQAARVMDGYDKMFSLSEQSQGDWTTFAYGLAGDAVDAVIMCPVTANGSILPLLVVHNSDQDGDNRETVARRLQSIWDLSN